MTKEQAEEYIPLLKAYAEGKPIQYLAAGGWMDWEYPSFHDSPDNYRIKPESVTYVMSVWVTDDGSLISENDMSKYAPNWRKATAVVTID